MEPTAITPSRPAPAGWLQSSTAPWLAPAGPGSCQTLRDENIAEAAAVSDKDAKLAPVSVGIPSRPSVKLKRSLVNQCDKPVGGVVAAPQFRGAFRLANFRRVDIGNADFVTVQPSVSPSIRLAVSHFRISLGSTTRSADTAVSGIAKIVMMLTVVTARESNTRGFCQVAFLSGLINMRPQFHILSVGLVIQSPVLHDRSISATSLLPKQLQEESHGILFPLEMVDQNLPCRPDPSPAARQACFTKKIRFDG